MKLKVSAAFGSPGARDSPTMKAVSRFKSNVDKQRTDLSVQSKAVQNRIATLKEKWEKLNDILTLRKTRLEEAIQSQQVHEYIYNNEYYSFRFSYMLGSLRLLLGPQSACSWDVAC